MGISKMGKTQKALFGIGAGCIGVIHKMNEREKNKNEEIVKGWMTRGDFISQCISGCHLKKIHKSGVYVICYNDGENFVELSECDVYNDALAKANESKRDFRIKFFLTTNIKSTKSRLMKEYM